MPVRLYGKKKRAPKKSRGKCILRPEKKSPKIADFGDFDFQNTQNQQNSNQTVTEGPKS